MIMNLLSVSLIRLKLVISSRAINNCFFERVGDRAFFLGGDAGVRVPLNTL